MAICRCRFSFDTQDQAIACSAWTETNWRTLLATARDREVFVVSREAACGPAIFIEFSFRDAPSLLCPTCATLLSILRRLRNQAPPIVERVLWQFRKARVGVLSRSQDLDHRAPKPVSHNQRYRRSPLPQARSKLAWRLSVYKARLLRCQRARLGEAMAAVPRHLVAAVHGKTTINGFAKA